MSFTISTNLTLITTDKSNHFVTINTQKMSQTKPPHKSKITFHEVHGNGIKLYHKCTTARRIETKDHNGLIFTSEPIKPFQKITIKLLEVSDNLPGVIGIGFTSHDPSTLPYDLPKTTRSDLKKKPGFWMCSLSKQRCVKGGILHFYVSVSGNIHFGVNGEEKSPFEKMIPTGGPLWGVIDIWSFPTAIQVYDPHFYTSKSSIFHTFSSDNLKISGNRVQKLDNNDSYAFTNRNLPLDKVIRVRFLSDGNFVLGITSCDPSRLQSTDLPENPDFLVDRSEYWVVVKDPSWNFKINDELTYSIATNGEMKIWKNHSLLLKKFYVDQTAKLWGLFVLTTVTKIEVTIGISEESLAPPAPIRNTERQVQGESSCVICCDAFAEAVLYPCGHMCMCTECAKQQWRGGGDGNCPLCRIKIKDVMKVYKS